MPTDRRTELLDRAAALARAAGLGDESARVLQAILTTEGAFEGQVGDQGNSYGPLQFHRRGELPNYAKARGVSVDQAGRLAQQDPEDAIEWALSSYLGTAIKTGQQRGVQGAQLATYAQQNGQRSETPERAGANYRALFSGGGGGGVAEPGTKNEQGPKAESEYLNGLRKERQQIADDLKAIQDKIDAIPEGERFTSYGAYPTLAKRYDDLRGRLTAADKEIRDYQAEVERDARKAASQRADEETPRDRAATAYQEAQRRILEEKWPIEKANMQRAAQIADEKERRAAIEDSLNNMKDLLAMQIQAGNLTDKQADTALNRALSAATLGVNATTAGYNALRQMAPQMGDKQLAQAAVATLRGWNQFPGVNIPEFELPVYQANPLEDIRGYAPSAQQAQDLWKKAIGEGPEAKRAEDERAAGLLAKAQAAIDGEGGAWRGAVQQETTSAQQAPSPGVDAANGYNPDATMMPTQAPWQLAEADPATEPWRAALLLSSRQNGQSPPNWDNANSPRDPYASEPGPKPLSMLARGGYEPEIAPNARTLPRGGYEPEGDPNARPPLGPRQPDTGDARQPGESEDEWLQRMEAKYGPGIP